MAVLLRKKWDAYVFTQAASKTSTGNILQAMCRMPCIKKNKTRKKIDAEEIQIPLDAQRLLFYDNMGCYVIFHEEYRWTRLAALPICLQSRHTRR
jgi:hypothetical protein